MSNQTMGWLDMKQGKRQHQRQWQQRPLPGQSLICVEDKRTKKTDVATERGKERRH